MEIYILYKPREIPITETFFKQKILGSSSISLGKTSHIIPV
ncbi:MAG: hypothetical protein ACFIN4_01075 [Candidatus Walczuchella monophlebidarum]